MEAVNTLIDEASAVCGTCGEHLFRFSDAWRAYVPRDCACKRRIREEEERRETEARERNRRNEARRRCFGKQDLLKGQTFDSFCRDNGNALSAKERCVRYASDFDRMKETGRGLFLLGRPGVGKTHLAAALCNSLIDSRPGFRALFTDFREVTKALIAGDEDFEEKLKTFDLVVFDGFGAEFRTRLTEDKIKEAVNLRVGAGLPIIVTSNYTRERMSKPENEFEKYVFSRFYEACDSLYVDGEDVRMLLHTERKKEAE